MAGPLTRDVLRFYPQIYLACHVAHTRARTNPYRLTDRDVTLLGHLDENVSITAGRLARHLGIGPPALSARLLRLEALGHLERRTHPRDRRTTDVRLTAAGADAIAGTSVLDPDRVTKLLRVLPPDQRRRAVDGLGVLARAARTLQLRSSSRRAPR